MEVALNLLKAFLLGGLFCVIGQLLIDYTRLTPAKILVGYVVTGVVLTGAGLYGYVASFGGAGATIPLVGFGYALAEGAKTAVSEQGLIGVLSGPLSSCSVGVMAAVLCGLLCSLLSRSKEK